MYYFIGGNMDFTLADGSSIDEGCIGSKLEGVGRIVQMHIIVTNIPADIVVDGENLFIFTFSVQVQLRQYRIDFLCDGGFL